MSRTDDVLDPIRTLKREATKIAESRGFKIVRFAIEPDCDDGLAHATMLAEWDPDKTSVPDVIIVQAAQALQEQQEKAYQDKLDADVEEAKKNIQQDLGLDDKDLRKRGRGFLD